MSTMKKNEISYFEIEFLEKNENLDRKLKNKIFFVAEMIEWLTIIDVKGNLEQFKI